MAELTPEPTPEPAEPDPKAEPSWWRRLGHPNSQRSLAALIIGGLVWMAVAAESWPFDEQTRDASALEDPSLWQLLLYDGTTLGFVRLALVILAFYVIVSVPALVMAGRWLKGFGTSGVSADAAASASKSIDELQSEIVSLTEELDRVKQERDDYRSLARRFVESLRGKKDNPS